MNSTLAVKSKHAMLAYIASGILSGVFVSINSPSFFFYWIPGFVFGLSFAVTNFKKKWHRVIYTILSGVIYRLVVAIAIYIGGKHLVVACLFAGLCGALGLAIITRLLSNIQFLLHDELKIALIGGIAGVAFSLILDNLKVKYLSAALAYVIWQVPVAMLLASSIEKQMVKRATLLAEKVAQVDSSKPTHPVQNVPELYVLKDLPTENQPTPETQVETDISEVDSKLPASPSKAKQGSIQGWVFAIVIILVVGIIITAVSSSNSNSYSPSDYSNNTPSATDTPTPAPQIFSFKVNGDVTTDIQVATNEYVWVQAKGTISLGVIVGDVSPDGETAGIWQSYNIDRQFPYGSLLCRIEGEPWQLCGSDRELRFSKSGRLEFAINDDTIGSRHTNSSWDVKAIVSNYSYKSSIPSTAKPAEPAREPSKYLSIDEDCQVTKRDYLGAGTTAGWKRVTNLSNYPINIFTSIDFGMSEQGPVLISPGETKEFSTGRYFSSDEGASCAMRMRAEWAK